MQLLKTKVRDRVYDLLDRQISERRGSALSLPMSPKQRACPHVLIATRRYSCPIDFGVPAVFIHFVSINFYTVLSMPIKDGCPKVEKIPLNDKHPVETTIKIV